jgi:hypothetical protein
MTNRGEGSSSIGSGLRIRAARQVEVVRLPAAARGSNALAIHGRGKIGIRGHARRAQLIEEEAKMAVPVADGVGRPHSRWSAGSAGWLQEAW